MKPGATGIYCDPKRGELARPAASQPDLRALRRGVGRSARRRPVHDLGVDLNDAPDAPRLHPGDDGTAQQHRALYEEVELGGVVFSGHVGERRFQLWTGRVEHEHVDRAKGTGDRCDDARDSHSSVTSPAKESGHSAIVADAPYDVECSCPTADVIDRHGQAVARKALRDRAAEPAGATRHESHAALTGACPGGFPVRVLVAFSAVCVADLM
jgi:hypothetical protein